MRLLAMLLAVVTACMAPTAFAAEVFDLQKENIRIDTEYLCDEIGVRVTGTPQEVRTADWIQSRLESMGYSMQDGTLFRVGFTGYADMASENVGAVINPDPDLPLFTVVAHYDTVATTLGARDNSASVAILLEMARYLKENGPVADCELRLVLLGSEENGYYGAKAYVESLSEADHARHMGGFNMDVSIAAPADNAVLVMNMLGGKNDQGEVVDAVYLKALENTVTRYVKKAYNELYDMEIGAVFYHGESDHLPFQEGGLEAANICWRRIVDHRPVMPSNYHTMDDVYDDLDYNTAVISARCVLRAIEMIAQDVKSGAIAF